MLTTGEGPANARYLGRFAVLELAGRGAMGTVYVAYDHTLDRRVALKVLRGSANQGRLRERARREALAMARVNHPNVAAIYEVGEADGRLFFAMEYVPGPTLSRWLAEAAPTWGQRLSLICAAGRGLAAAHASGLVHRDFKPANVLVGEDGRPRVIDFGLAREPHLLVESPVSTPPPNAAADDLNTTLTQTGVLMGTPAYMAPEVARGQAPTALSDQFAFCVTAYEALVGCPPFPRDSLPLLRDAIERGALEVPPGSPLPPAVLAALRRGLSAAPGDRWPSMDALLTVLEASGLESALQRHVARMRGLAAGGLALVGLALGVMPGVGRGVVEPAHMVVVEVGVAALFCAIGAFLGWGVSDPARRRLAAIAALLGISKLACALTGLRMGATSLQMFASDSLVMATFVGVSTVVIAPVPRLGILAAITTVGCMWVWPAEAALIHHMGWFATGAAFAFFRPGQAQGSAR